MSKLKPYRKAIVAAAIAGLTALYAAMSDDVITSGEWVMITLALLGGGTATYAVPNAAKPPANTGTESRDRHVL